MTEKSPTSAGSSPGASTSRPLKSESPPAATGAPITVAGGTTANLLPGEHWRTPYEDDQDSAHGDDDDFESTASMSSSILSYRTIHGRTFHSERGNAQYWGSNDNQQIESMDMNHHALTLAIDDRLYLAPLKRDIRKAVDIGTGTGIWAIDFADEHPGCEVVGTDISPIQPGWVPPNLEFHIDDCTQEWTFAADSLDYIHMRYLTGSITDWKSMLAEAFTCCKPGGYVESLESAPWMESDDGTVTETSAMGQWGKIFVNASRRMGRTFTIVCDGLQREAMEAAGFVDIQEYNIKVPIGDWPKDRKMKEMGKFTRATLSHDPEGYVLYMATEEGWTKDEVTVYAAHLRREMRNKNIHAFFRMKVVWGRKPDV